MVLSTDTKKNCFEPIVSNTTHFTSQFYLINYSETYFAIYKKNEYTYAVKNPNNMLILSANFRAFNNETDSPEPNLM